MIFAVAVLALAWAKRELCDNGKHLAASKYPCKNVDVDAVIPFKDLTVAGGRVFPGSGFTILKQADGKPHPMCILVISPSQCHCGSHCTDKHHVIVITENCHAPDHQTRTLAFFSFFLFCFLCFIFASYAVSYASHSVTLTCQYRLPSVLLPLRSFISTQKSVRVKRDELVATRSTRRSSALPPAACCHRLLQVRGRGCKEVLQQVPDNNNMHEKRDKKKQGSIDVLSYIPSMRREFQTGKFHTRRAIDIPLRPNCFLTYHASLFPAYLYRPPTHSLPALAQICTSGDTGSDVWGYSDHGRDFALVCLAQSTAFVEVTEPANPVTLGYLPAPAGAKPTEWCDIKVLGSTMYVVRESSGTWARARAN